MKLTIVSAILSLQVSALSVFHPQRISYDALVSGGASDALFEEALTKTGLLVVTGIPEFPCDLALSEFDKCAKVSKKAQSFTFEDGTERVTIATHSGPGTIQAMDHQDTLCDSFNEQSKVFRAKVASATDAFANKLSQVFKVEVEEPLLATAENYAFETLKDIVENGEHLEHFHSYQKTQESSQETIEMHIDQGLFIAFTPGRVVELEDARLTRGFYIEQESRKVSEVSFEPHDDLVFMMGDGFNQYINEKITKKIRAVPHSLIMGTEQGPRVWYGRMVLPPLDAVHPTHGISFGSLREQMIEDSLNNKEKGLGCSGSQITRDLSTTTCENDTMLCWHRCMNITEHQVSAEICSDQGLELKCINPRLQLSDGESHGDFYPGCVNTSDAMEATAYPNLPQYPRDETCSEFQEFATSNEYEHSVELEGGATLMWSVEGEDIKGLLAFDGLFGWIAVGFANPAGSKNGMAGATIIMALPGGNYSAFSGLDLSLENTIDEYVIDLDLTAFRHWMIPVSERESEVVATERQAPVKLLYVEETPCYTALKFKKSGIYNKKFNITGWDDLVWGANGEDYYAGYHGGQSRGRFQVNWATGEATGRVVINKPAEGGTDKASDSAASAGMIAGLVALCVLALF